MYICCQEFENLCITDIILGIDDRNHDNLYDNEQIKIPEICYIN